MTTKNKELTEEQIQVLNESYPVEDENGGLRLPRLCMLSKDIVEETGTGKNKKIKVIEAAGTFFTEKDEGEVSEEGKKVWTKTFLTDEEIDVIIVYHRKQLRKFDSSLQKYISSPIFDNDDQVVPLYLDRQVIKRGTREQLQSLYPALTQKGKPTSDLKEECILYVVYEGEFYQMNISQSSKWEFKTYKKGLNPSTVVTTLGTVEDTFGTNTYRKLTFTNKRMITPDEFDTVTEDQTKVKDLVNSDAKFYLGNGNASNEDESDKAFKKLEAENK